MISQIYLYSAGKHYVFVNWGSCADAFVGVKNVIKMKTNITKKLKMVISI